MNKQRVKDLCEGDDQLQWWAMVLFAEVCNWLEDVRNGHCDMKTAFPSIAYKEIEFEKLVVQRMEELTKEKAKMKPSLEQRVAAIEEQLGILR